MDPYQRIRESEAGPLWEKVGIRHHHGINIPLFCLHSKDSCGIGEYLDLIPMIDWCESLGFDVIQLLPLNDSGDLNSPYRALTAFALNPIHLSLAKLPHIEEHPDLEKWVGEMHALCKPQRVPYKQVREEKKRFMREYFQRERERIESTDRYKLFVKDEWWLKGYALFKALKMHEHWTSWK